MGCSAGLIEVMKCGRPADSHESAGRFCFVGSEGSPVAPRQVARGCELCLLLVGCASTVWVSLIDRAACRGATGLPCRLVATRWSGWRIGRGGNLIGELLGEWAARQVGLKS